MRLCVVSDKNMTANLESQKLASDKAEAQNIANKLLKSSKTRKIVDVSCQRFDVKSAEFLKRFAYLSRFYNELKFYDSNDIETTLDKASYAIANTKTELSKEICESLVLDIMLKHYIQTQKNIFLSNSYIIKTSQNKGSAYGDTIRSSLDTYIANKAIIQVTKSYMLEHNLSTDMSKYYNKLNLNSAIVKTRLEQLKAVITA
jgi:hypothetical protein